MILNSLSFSEIWVVHFLTTLKDDGLPFPQYVVAKEVVSQKTIRLSGSELHEAKACPFSKNDKVLFVCYDSSSAMQCFVSLNWALPVNMVDLKVEFRRILSGHEGEHSFSLLEALEYFNLPHRYSVGPVEPCGTMHFQQSHGCFPSIYAKQDCEGTADAICLLYQKMKSELHFPYCLIRGKYMQSVAFMEIQGIPIDTSLLNLLLDKWKWICEKMIGQKDPNGVYNSGSFCEHNFENYLHEKQIPWPRHPSGKLRLDEETFRFKARAYPKYIARYYELRCALNKLKLPNLAISSDGRNRVNLGPFRSTTSRNQPSSIRFIFGPSTWTRGLIKPNKGTFIAYIDWCQQELGIAAALSGDKNMQDAYNSGDPYLTFAQMAHAVPATATKESHPTERAVYKICMLAVQYGMGPESLAQELGKPVYEANQLLGAHKMAFPAYWEWNQRIMDTGFGEGRPETSFGWTRKIYPESKPASVGNFPVQGNGAEMLRIAIGFMHEAGVKVCAPIHDAVLIEGEMNKEDEILIIAQNCMQKASEIVLGGFSLDTDVKVVRAPNRYMDEDRGKAFWNEIMTLIEQPLYQSSNPSTATTNHN